MDVIAKTNQIRQAVIELVTYFAVFDLLVPMDRIVNFLPVKANHLAVQAAVRELVLQGVFKRIGDSYGLKSVRYYRADSMSYHRQTLMKRAERLSRIFRILPFVKSVVVINSVALGNVRDESDIDLLIVTAPGRIFITRGLLWYFLRFTKLLQTETDTAGKFSLSLFLTTRGVPMERDIMMTIEPHLMYWILSAVPVYGAKSWAETIQASQYIRERSPNVIWPRGGKSIDRSGWRWLDSWDDRGYRLHLKHTSQQPRNQTEKAFVRIRPDIINLHPLDQSKKIADTYTALLNKVRKVVSARDRRR
ncbi:MAG: nucleotidyltransferase domain-containing protein [bacterium]